SRASGYWPVSPYHAPSPLLQVGSQICGCLMGFSFSGLPTVPVPPTTNTSPVGSSTRLWLTRPIIVSAEEVQSWFCWAAVRWMVLVVPTEGLGHGSVSREPHFITLPGRYITAEPPLNPLVLVAGHCDQVGVCAFTSRR